MKKVLSILVISILSLNLTAQLYHDSFVKSSTKGALSGDNEIDERLHYYNIGYYFLDIEMNNASTYVLGSTTIYLNLNNAYNNQLVFDFKENMTHDSVKVNGVLTSIIRNGDLMVIPYEYTTDFNADYQVEVVIWYHGLPQAGMFNSALNFMMEDYNYTYSLTEPYEAKYWFPCKQVLSDKADSSAVSITIPEDLKAGSNGLLVAEVPLGNGKKRVEWKSSYPIDYYLISVAIGDYEELSYYAPLYEYNDSVFMQNYYPNSIVYLSLYEPNMRRVDTMMSVLSHLWGIYPFHEEKYGHCIVNLGGGMEHQTMTTVGNFGFRLIQHELGHSWFGDYVTCATWQDIWVNEGFASYAEYLGDEFIHDQATADGWLEETQTIAKESINGSVYVPFNELDDVSRIFNYSLSYRKGACLVHMMRYLVDNDEVFFAALRTFLSTYAHSTATGDDLKEIMDAETSISFESFFENWYYGEGFPIYNVEWYQTETNLYLRNTQTTTASVTPFFEIPIEYELVYANGEKDTIRLEQTQNIQDYTIEIASEIVNINVDPENFVLKELQSVTETTVASFESTTFNIYPNPAKTLLYINSSSFGEYKFSIYSTDGKLILDGERTGAFSSINIEDLCTGIYILRLTEKTGDIRNYRIIKE